jgi:hypothetical protein
VSRRSTTRTGCLDCTSTACESAGHRSVWNPAADSLSPRYKTAIAETRLRHAVPRGGDESRVNHALLHSEPLAQRLPCKSLLQAKERGMRAIIQLAGAGVIGALLVVGCSASDSDVANAAGAAGTTPAVDAGSRGIDERAGAGGTAGRSGAGVASGGAPMDGEGGDAGAGGACAGDYLCPLVGYGSRATISFDLPISVAAAADAVFTACRNSECHTAKGSATAVPNNPRWGWSSEDSGSGRSIFLTFDDSGRPPFGVLLWSFELDFETISNDHYSLTVQPVGAAVPTTLFDTQVNYMTVVYDPSLVSEGFCHHCSEVSIAELDLRTAK